jgi:hypothetical protein
MLLQWKRIICLTCLAVLYADACIAAGEDRLVTTAQMKDGEAVPYVLNALNDMPRYVMILFPGSTGIMDPHMEGDQVVYRERTNFLIRSRPYLIDEEFATVATNATSSEERIQAVIDDIKNRFPQAKIYLMGTSRGTGDTIALAGYLSDKIAGEIHTSSLQRINGLDPKKYQNRQLIVHHRNDGCRATPYAAAQWSHEHYGTDFIPVEGGSSVSDPCEALSYHGYYGIEKETMASIKQWVKQGG